MTQEMKNGNTDAVVRKTEVRPEAELESRLYSALLQAFPNIPGDDLKAQMNFTVRLGHDTYDVDAAANWQKRGRADLILNLRGRSLAVVEVKREDKALVSNVFEQAQSYANLLSPRPPLLVITNGKETHVYDSCTGAPWSTGDDSAGAVEKLFSNAAKVAAADKRWAIEALMGRETELWVSMVRKRTAKLVASMTDLPGCAGRPFARDILFPRRSSYAAYQTLMDGEKPLFTIIHGAPLAGKSSVLRELTVATRDSPELAVLMLRGNRTGLFQAIANLFAAELEWSLDSNDVRQWIRRMSLGNTGPTLVLAIDGLEPASSMAADLEELPDLLSGTRVKVILTTDQVDALTKTTNGRGFTALGERFYTVSVNPLDISEFEQATAVLGKFGIVFHGGAELCQDYRAPWLLRYLYDDHVREVNSGFERIYPPALGLELIALARKVHAGQHDLERGYRLLARCMLADEDSIQSELALAISNGFLVRQDALSNEARVAAEKLQATGAVRFYRHPVGEDVVVPMLPAAFLSELGRAAADELIDRISEDPVDAGWWLGWRLDSVYLADLAGAEALRIITERSGSIKSEVIDGLLSTEPVVMEIPMSSCYGFQAPDGSTIYFKIHEGHLWTVDRSRSLLEQVGKIDGSFGKCYSRLTAWMILGQFARIPTTIANDIERRLDADLLLLIGRNEFPLIRGNEESLPYQIHEIGDQSMLCGSFANSEPTTIAMADLLSSSWVGTDEWIEFALQSSNHSLIYRIDAALRIVQKRSIPERSEWAQKCRNETVLPALEALLLNVTQNDSTDSPSSD